MGKHASHALIGRYVYLHYLRDRQILSDRKLDRWGIQPSAVFGREATLEGFRRLWEHLSEWLNGDVFPLDLDAPGSPRQKHLQLVAAVFMGDEPSGGGSLQLHLDFKAYDFSHIPVETLSVVYEQFLHMPDGSDGTTAARKTGAYYTPIPVVNFVLAELEDNLPLEEGRRILDPSCGSGAFLVQCYRRLVEKKFPPGTSPTPADLEELLTEHIFGVDSDPDACNVAELNLILALLDNVDPPDLEGGTGGFKLPALRNRNIFPDNFFGSDSQWRQMHANTKFDWIVGNPPWKLLPTSGDNVDRAALEWVAANANERPVSNLQVAQAFAWEAAEFATPEGEIALLLPAMVLFEKSKSFRKAFFKRMTVRAVANLANLRRVLFARRAVAPATAIFYAQRSSAEQGEQQDDECVSCYSPFIANQEATRPLAKGEKSESWSLVVNASEIRDIRLGDIADGSMLPWKLAMWGSHLDGRLLRAVSRRFLALREMESEGVVAMSQGLELRQAPTESTTEEEETKQEGKRKETLEAVAEVIGKNELEMEALKGARRLFSIPEGALKKIGKERAFARKRGGVATPLSVCRPPHIIVSAARNFAIYTEEFVVVPPRQIGIVSPSGDNDLLKALCLFLNSDFAYCHQFLYSPQLGIERGRATLDALKQLPVPELTGADLAEWCDLHSRLAAASAEALRASNGELFHPLGSEQQREDFKCLLRELNHLVNEALGLDHRAEAMVHDLVNVRCKLDDGAVGAAAVRQPNRQEMEAYAERMKCELDAFIGDELPKQHQVTVFHDGRSGIVQVELTKDLKGTAQPEVVRAGENAAKYMERIRRRLQVKQSQWVYFNRNLRIYEGPSTFVFKPMQRLHWTQSQAMIDAGEIIAETLSGVGD